MKLVKNAKYLKDFKVSVTFDNDETYQIDFEKVLEGPIFEPLKDVEEFKKFIVHPELEVISWSNGADFSPEFLYDLAKQQDSA